MIMWRRNERMMTLEEAIKQAEEQALIVEDLKGHISQDWAQALRLLVRLAKKGAKKEACEQAINKQGI